VDPHHPAVIPVRLPRHQSLALQLATRRSWWGAAPVRPGPACPAWRARRRPGPTGRRAWAQ
jgi:hypothetical protein